MKSGVMLTTLQKTLQWARSQSLWYYSVSTGCCADEVLSSFGCRYDLERFGCQPQVDASQADLLIVSGMVTLKSRPELVRLYERMLRPRYVMAIGACADCGGPFADPGSAGDFEGVNEVIPVDVFVPGCPPRPEAIMNGLILLQEKIRGRKA